VAETLAVAELAVHAIIIKPESADDTHRNEYPKEEKYIQTGLHQLRICIGKKRERAG
jgi:hypothetical protein